MGSSNYTSTNVKDGATCNRYCIKAVSNTGFFSPILRLQKQQNFRNLELSKKSFHFDGEIWTFPRVEKKTPDF